MEHHPRLDINNLSVPYSKIIIGSFPVWTLIHTADKGAKSSFSKDEFPFFFGSSKNLFWSWYQKYLDSEIKLLDEICIRNSLNKNRIGITDIILSCKRKGKSSLDKDLSQRVYNYHFMKLPKDGEILKLMCTSKGVMNEMLLSNSFFQQHKNLNVNQIKSLAFQNKFINKIGGDITALKKPIFVELNVKETTGVIQCLAIPSPGSPFRKLVEFGVDKNVTKEYLQNYLWQAFNWFIS